MDFEEIEKNQFINCDDSWDDEAADRAKNALNILEFGITYLDHALDGIEVNDFIVLGAFSGGGKSQALVTIALNSVKAGKRVYFFALEAEKHEVLRRIKFPLYVAEYFKDPEREPIRGLRFSQFRLNRYNHIFKKYDKLVETQHRKVLKNLNVFYRNSTFGVADFVTRVTSIKNKADIVILDHLNYFDFDSSEKEHQAMSEAVKGIRTLQVDLGIPVLMAAHVRKKAAGDKTIIPSVEEFHGSSDIYKNATKCVMLAPCYEKTGNNHEYKTYIQAGKQRHDGSVSRFASLCVYDISTNAYKPDYQIGTLTGGRSRFEQIALEKDCPAWAVYTKPTVAPSEARPWEGGFR